MKIRLNSISKKLGLLFATIFSIILISMEAILYSYFLDFYTTDVIEELTQRSEAYSEILSDHFDETTMDHVVLMESTSSKMVLILDSTRNTLVASDGIDLLPKQYLTGITNHTFDIQHGQVLASDWKNEQYFVAESTIKKNGETIGRVLMFSPTQPVKKAVTILTGTFIIVGLITILISTLLLFFTTNKLVQPLLRINKVTRLIAHGDYQWKLEVKGKDEIAQLTQSIIYMANKIKNYQQQRNRFLADISHELRTPLTYFKGYLEVLLSEMVNKREDRDRYLRLLLNQSLQLQRLVQDLSDLAALEQDDFQLNPHLVSIEKVMINSLELIGHSIEQQDISLTCELSAIPLYVMGDDQRLQQVIINLLENAKKYTKQDGNIYIYTYKEDNNCIIKIKDTGIGIPKSKLDKIWDRLYRVENSRSRNTGGSGLGLTISKKIILLHRGDIFVESEEGKGTIFIVKLPLYL
ncbi:HAMP domain-containing sensor histidine kinase [Niallia sp. FSL W8-0635]|uniref:HAMP domain-containing sensor histidine kinase n=1 Tax=Niallia sp. FSL W8-0635 TaxID=2975337 RepID=UPI002B043200|nr:HAMP domain-containing histidine kinase [Yersinia enterocolitica]